MIAPLIPVLFAGLVFDADTLDYLRRLREAGSSISAVNASAVDTLVRGLKREGLWSALKACCLLAGPNDLTGALVPLRADMPAATNNNFVAADYSRTTGLKGDGASKYLATGFSGTTVAQDDAHASVWVQTPHTAGSAGAYIGNSTISTPVGRTLISRSGLNPNNLTTQIHSVAHGGAGGGGSAGCVAIARNTSAGFTVRRSGANVVISTASVPPVAANYELFRLTDGAAYTDARLSFYSIGEALDLAKLDTLLTAYMAALR